MRAAAEHFTSLGYRVPHHINPAEFLLELVNIDFASDKAAARAELAKMQTAWSGSWRAEQLRTDIAALDVGTAGNRPGGDRSMKAIEENHKNHLREKPGPVSVVLTLLHRSFIKSYRDVVVYGIRLAMYLGLAIMMGTVWVRLPAEQKSIIPLINAIVSFFPLWLRSQGTGC